jgi:four helix bundle protein
MKYNILAEKSYAFSVRATRMYQYLLHTKKEYILSKQFVRAATSIGASVEEAIGA